MSLKSRSRSYLRKILGWRSFFDEHTSSPATAAPLWFTLSHTVPLVRTPLLLDLRYYWAFYLDIFKAHITREIKDGFIIKNISFFADGKNHIYTERVKYLDVKKMKSYFEKVGFTITNIFGDYNLSNFDAQTSNRLILVAKWIISY